jgi:hypothetical protein
VRVLLNKRFPSPQLPFLTIRRIAASTQCPGYA